MKQLELFASGLSQSDENKHYWKMFIDGAARNNPGPAGAGIYILKDESFFQEHGYFLGSKTNNQAEYLALILGLLHVKKNAQHGDIVHTISDSQLLVRQCRGEYKVKHKELIPLHNLARLWLSELHGEIFHVLRFDNQEADRMANQGIDRKIKIPAEFLNILNQHGIVL
jgi:ribonuclease HI